MKYKIILFYKYVNIPDPEDVMKDQLEICQKLNLKGRTIVAKEGINSTLGGTEKNISEYIDYMREKKEFNDIHFKISEGNGPDDFPKLSVKVRDEIVSSHLGKQDIDPTKLTGDYITAEELHDWFEKNKEFYLVDMRNSYEYKVGHFKNSIDSTFDNFRDLPKVLEKIEHLKDKVVVTACTGGIRCEKASGYLLKNGFKEVYQLYGGMQTYMQKFPNDNFLGKLYVFDGRVAIDFDNPKNHVVVGKCDLCGVSCEQYVNCKLPECNKHFICCENCKDIDTGKAFCSKKCKEKLLAKSEALQ